MPEVKCEAQVNQEANVNRVESALIFKVGIKLEFHNGNQVNFYAHRVCFLDGVLCVIGEDLDSKHLNYHYFDSIKDVTPFTFEVSPRYSVLEINGFISAMRLVHNNEERIVLRVFGNQEINLIPKFHHLHNPYVTMGKSGDLVWAASIEVCDDLFLWLHSIKDHIEILDPSTIKEQFGRFCSSQVGEKKAS